MEFLILMLATFRITSLLVDEDGPLSLFSRFRQLVGVRVDKNGETYGKNVIATGLTCLWCTSVWVGIAWAIAYFFSPNGTILIAMPLALSSGAILVSRWLNG